MTEEEKNAIEIVKGLAVYYDDYSLLDEEEIKENEQLRTEVNSLKEDNERYQELELQILESEE